MVARHWKYLMRLISADQWSCSCLLSGAVAAGIHSAGSMGSEIVVTPWNGPVPSNRGPYLALYIHCFLLECLIFKRWNNASDGMWNTDMFFATFPRYLWIVVCCKPFDHQMFIVSHCSLVLHFSANQFMLHAVVFWLHWTNLALLFVCMCV